MTRFIEDLESDDTIAFLQWDQDQGVAAGASATPAVYVCGQAIAWARLEMVIDAILGN